MSLLLTTGQMAELHKTTKRTLQFYDKLGIFSPAEKNKYDFRFYSYEQSPKLEMILTLAELGMSLDDIKKYSKECTPQKLTKILQDKQKEMQTKIMELELMQKMIAEQIVNLKKATSIKVNVPYLEEQNEELLLATPELDIDSLDVIYDSVSKTLKKNFAHHVFCYISGSILPEKAWSNGDYNATNQYYFKSSALNKKNSTYVKQKGTYLCINWKGNWDTLNGAYPTLFNYAKRRKITLTGSAFEEDVIDSMSANSENDFVTKVMIRCS